MRIIISVTGRFTATGGGRNKLVAALDIAHITAACVHKIINNEATKPSKTNFLMVWVSFANCSRQSGCDCTVTKNYYTEYYTQCHLAFFCHHGNFFMTLVMYKMNFFCGG